MTNYTDRDTQQIIYYSRQNSLLQNLSLPEKEYEVKQVPWSDILEIWHKWRKKRATLAIDTETEGLWDGRKSIVMLQISDGNEVTVIDIRGADFIYPELNQLLCSTTAIGHNIKFDYKFLRLKNVVLDSVYDTFLAECILTNGLTGRSLGLASIAKKYLGITLDKTVRNKFVELEGAPFTTKQIIYGARDVLYLHRIYAKQLEELKKWDLIPVFDLSCDATLAIGDIEFNGLSFNTERWVSLAKENEVLASQLLLELNSEASILPALTPLIPKYIQGNLFEKAAPQGIDINWDSPSQVATVLKLLGIKADSTSEKDIAKYQHEYPIIKKFIDYKKQQKLVTTYGKTFLNYINPNTGRIHPEFWDILDTYRVSCGGSKTNNRSSVNLQNIPAKNEYLNCFIAPKSWKFIGIDYGGQEARIAACGSKDSVWCNTYLEGKDLHTEVCKMMFGITDDLVRTKPDFLRGKSYRDVAKTINFGALFGMSEFKLSNTLQIPVTEAKALLTKYFAATDKLGTYLKNCAKYGLEKGYIRSYKPISAIRWFPQWVSPEERHGLPEWYKVRGEIERACYNTPIQTTGAIITKLALVMIRKEINKNWFGRVQLVHTVHDAIYTIAKEEIAEEWAQVKNSLMLQAWRTFFLAFPMETDITIDDYWTK